MIDTVQRRMLAHIANAYTNIHVTEAMQFFGMPKDELLKGRIFRTLDGRVSDR